VEEVLGRVGGLHSPSPSYQLVHGTPGGLHLLLGATFTLLQGGGRRRAAQAIRSASWQTTFT